MKEKEPFLEFEWPVAPGHEWKDWLGPNDEPVTVPHDCLASHTAVLRAADRLPETGPVLSAVLSGRATRKYRPMQRETAGLFRTFAELDCQSLDSIRQFADEHGLLGLQPQRQTIAGRGERPYHHVSGESHLQWATEIWEMRTALSLAEEVREIETGRPAATQEAEFDQRGRHRRLAWLFNRHLQHVQPTMSYETGRPALSFAPLTLLAAMWMQLASAEAGGKQYAKCKFCQRFIEISTEQTGFRSHREFCSGSCKTSDYRNRKRSATRMAAAGKSANQIAADTRTEIQTVRRWLKAVQPTAEARRVTAAGSQR